MAPKQERAKEYPNEGLKKQLLDVTGGKLYPEIAEVLSYPEFVKEAGAFIKDQEKANKGQKKNWIFSYREDAAKPSVPIESAQYGLFCIARDIKSLRGTIELQQRTFERGSIKPEQAKFLIGVFEAPADYPDVAKLLEVMEFSTEEIQYLKRYCDLYGFVNENSRMPFVFTDQRKRLEAAIEYAQGKLDQLDRVEAERRYALDQKLKELPLEYPARGSETNSK